MRADVFHYYPRPIESVYNAYQAAIQSTFQKEPTGTPCHTLVFGLSRSLKYNMNGGGCHVHLAPYGGGTVIGIRYTLAQALGARYKAHDKDMTAAVEQLLGVGAQEIQTTMEAVLQSKPLSSGAPTPVTRPTPAPTPQAPTTPIAQPQTPPTAPMAAAAPARARFCPHGGTPFAEGSFFCGNCGTKRP